MPLPGRASWNIARPNGRLFAVATISSRIAP
jgi:hypothetical protein